MQTVDATRVVVCFGDSNTHGSLPMRDLQDVRRLPADQRWTGLLAGLLGPGWQLYEEGLPGRTTVHSDPIEGEHLNGLKAVPVVIGTHSPVDAVVVALGVNDFKARFGVTAADIAASVEVVAGAVRTWSQGPGRTDPVLVVVAPPPILETGCLAPYFAGGAATSQELGSLLADSARRLGAAFVDAGRYVQSSDTDGIHWEPDQHRPLAEAIAVALQEAVAAAQ